MEVCAHRLSWDLFLLSPNRLGIHPLPLIRFGGFQNGSFSISGGGAGGCEISPSPFVKKTSKPNASAATPSSDSSSKPSSEVSNQSYAASTEPPQESTSKQAELLVSDEVPPDQHLPAVTPPTLTDIEAKAVGEATVQALSDMADECPQQ